MSLKQTKSQIRKSIKSKLRLIPLQALTAQSDNVHHQLLQLDQFKLAKSVAIYMNMENLEVQTKSIIKSCFDLNKLVYLPKIENCIKINRKPSHLQMIPITNYQDIINLKPSGKYNLLEPNSGIDIFDSNQQLDLILIPGVAFDLSKHRLGHGGGYYDEFLSTYFKNYQKIPYLIGLGLNQQLIDNIPIESHDWTLNKLIIDDTVID